MNIVDALCERCLTPIRWRAGRPMVCADCEELTPYEQAIRTVENLLRKSKVK